MTMRVPLVDLKRQYASIKDEIDAAIAGVLGECNFIMGAPVAAFEAAFADVIGCAGSVGVASGTAALHLSLRALGIGPGDEVITVAHSFMATAEAISMVGAVPVFVDIDPATYCMDADRAAEAVGERTRAIVPVHLYGHPAPMTALTALAARHGLKVVEDACQAHGAALPDGARVGTLGDLACFSFFPGKNLGAFGDAGGVTGTDMAALERVRRLRNHGRASKHEHAEIGFGERMDTLQAAILGAKLPHLDGWIEARRRIAAGYVQRLSGLDLVLPGERSGYRHAYHLFVIRVAERDRVLRHLNDRGIEAGIHYPVPLHRQPAYASGGCRAQALPETERAAAEILSLPIFPEMTEAQLDFVCASLAESLAEGGKGNG
jgi:dTDP-4-amino-4,6-dideoxygalactose transaminase